MKDINPQQKLLDEIYNLALHRLAIGLFCRRRYVVEIKRKDFKNWYGSTGDGSNPKIKCQK